MATRRIRKGSQASKGMTFAEIRDIAMDLPAVEDGTSYRTPALKVKGKLMARLREDGESVVFMVSLDESEMLRKARPEVFFITDHYRGYPAVLLRLSAATRRDADDVVRMSWLFVAPARLRQQAGQKGTGE